MLDYVTVSVRDAGRCLDVREALRPTYSVHIASSGDDGWYFVEERVVVELRGVGSVAVVSQVGPCPDHPLTHSSTSRGD